MEIILDAIRKQLSLDFIFRIKPDIRRAVYCGAAWSANQAVYGELIKYLANSWLDRDSPYFDQEVLSLEQGLGCLQDYNLTQT